MFQLEFGTKVIETHLKAFFFNINYSLKPSIRQKHPQSRIYLFKICIFKNNFKMALNNLIWTTLPVLTLLLSQNVNQKNVSQ